MEKYINEIGKECYKDVDPADKFHDLEFHAVDERFRDNEQVALHTNLGSFTVLDRMTGFGNGIRDIETGYRDSEGKFWLASGNYDVRDSGADTFQEAIEWVKKRANTCIGNKP